MHRNATPFEDKPQAQHSNDYNHTQIIKIAEPISQ